MNDAIHPQSATGCCPATRPPRIHIRGLAVHYGSATAIRGVDVQVRAGSIMAFVGPSGCGKSSLLNSLNRMTDLIPGARVEGEVTIGCDAVLGPHVDLSELRRRVGLIFQRPNPFPLSIRANLELPLSEHCRADRKNWPDRIEAALSAAGLWDEVRDRLQAPALSLSGGQQQRLCIARALVLQPQVLLFDEPCSALDPIASAIVEKHIVSLRERCTIIIVTHNLAQARRVADDLAVFWHQDGTGCLLEVGPAHQLFESPRHPLTNDYLNGACG